MPDNELNPVVGIDLGTTYSSIARWDGEQPQVIRLHDGSESLPSIVHMQEGDKPLVGLHARRRLKLDPANTVEKAKRYMGDDGKTYTLRNKPYSPVNISSMILRQLAADVAMKYPKSKGFSFAGVVITHPHYFNYNQIARTQEAAEQAGLPIIRLVSEPVAAALDYGFRTYARTDQHITENVVVFDLGGGTFDVTVIKIINEPTKLTFKVLSTGGDDMLGGTNFDEAFAEWVLQRESISLDSLDAKGKAQASATLIEAVIATKLDLSNSTEAYLTVPSIMPGKHIEIAVTRDDFNTIIKPYCDRIRRILADTIVRSNLREHEIHKSLLVGGSSLIPMMRTIVQEETGVEPWQCDDPSFPLLAVCRGAACLAAMDDNRTKRKEIAVEEVTSHALGVRAIGDAFAVIIPSNHPAPVEATKIFTVRKPTFVVEPYQGHATLTTAPGMAALRPITVENVRLNEHGIADVKITFTVNNQQILFVKIEAPGVCEERQLEF